MQIEQQIERLTSLYQIIPFNRSIQSQNEMLSSLVQELQTHFISEQIRQTYPEQSINTGLSQAHLFLTKRTEVNHERLNYIGLSSVPELKLALFETLILFNTPKGSEVKLDPVNKDASQKKWRLFYENAPSGIACILQQLPHEILRSVHSTTIYEYVRQYYPDLQNPLKQHDNPHICSILCSGEIGTAAYHPEQPIDFHLICDAPKTSLKWNDADFFIAAIQKIFSVTYQIYQEKLDQTKLSESVKKQIDEQYAELLSKDELQQFQIMFPDSYSYIYQLETEKYFEQEQTSVQAKILWSGIIEVLSQTPYFEKFFSQFRRFFSFMKVPADLMQAYWFPASLDKAWQEQIRKKLLEFYTKTYLKPHQLQSIFRHYKLSKSKDQGKDQDLTLLKHLQSTPQCASIVKKFLQNIVHSISFHQIDTFHQAFQLLQQLFDKKREILDSDLSDELTEIIQTNFFKQQFKIAQNYLDEERYKHQAKHEVEFYLKLQDATEYINTKFQKVSVRFHGHFLRNLQEDKLQSILTITHAPTGGKPLKDILYSSLTVAGHPLCPYQIPHLLHTFGKIGVLEANLFQTTYSGFSKDVEVSYLQLPHLGGLEKINQFGAAYILPFLLYETIKLEQWELPEALLNAWWLELAYCQEQQLTITELIDQPEKRKSLQLAKQGAEHCQAIVSIEQKFPRLASHFRWVQFAEIFTNSGKENRSYAAWCYGMYVSFERIIDETTQVRQLWSGQNQPWQMQFIFKFAELFLTDFTDDFFIANINGQLQQQIRQARKMRILFLETLQRTEKKILEYDAHRCLSKLMGLLLKKNDYEFANHAEKISTLTQEKLSEVYSRIILTEHNNNLQDQTALTEYESASESHTDFETLAHQTAEHLSQQYLNFNIFVPEEDLKAVLLSNCSHVQWNQNECAMLRLRLAMIFQSQSHQLHLPIAYMVGKPRRFITIHFEPNSQRWSFESTTFQVNQGYRKFNETSDPENKFEIFVNHLSHGLAQCLFSRYYGVEQNVKTIFKKKSDRKHILGTVPGNPVFPSTLEDLSHQILDFFVPQSIRSYEIFASKHYVRDIFVICNISRFNTVSIIIRANTGRIFVLELHTDRIPVKLHRRDMEVDPGIARFFLQLNHQKSRMELIRLINQCDLSFNENALPRYKIWVNPNNFETRLKPQYQQPYLRAIANAVWNSRQIGTYDFLKPVKFDCSLNSIGQKAVQQLTDIQN